MAGRSVTRKAYNALDKFGEEKVFALYLEHRSVERMLANIEPDVGPVSVGIFYRWLHADKTGVRWDHWQANKKIFGSSLVEEALDIVDEADDGSVQAARLRAEQRRWQAERMNRDEYGKPETGTTVNVVSLGHDYLEALKKVEKEFKREELEEAEYEIVSGEATE